MTCKYNILFFCPRVLQSHSWQPGIKNPYRGVVVWPVPENIEITVTLFKVGRSAGTGISMFYGGQGYLWNIMLADVDIF